MISSTPARLVYKRQPSLISEIIGVDRISYEELFEVPRLMQMFYEIGHTLQFENSIRTAQRFEIDEVDAVGRDLLSVMASYGDEQLGKFQSTTKHL